MKSTGFIKYFGFAVIIFALLFSSCASKKKVLLLQGDDQVGEIKFENPGATEYKVQKGDELYIKVYSLDPQTSKFFQSEWPSLMNNTYLYLNSYTVDEQGNIHFSFIDKLNVENFTAVEIRNKIQTALNEYFKECTVVVKLVNFKVSIIGEVNSPGTYTFYKDQVTLFQALGEAGGVKDFGNRTKVKLIRQVKGGSIVKEFDMSSQEILASNNLYLMPNDVIYIEPLKVKPYIATSTVTITLSTISLLVVMANLVLNFTNNN